MLFLAIKILNGEVPSNADQIVSVEVGVTYTTKRGLYLISGTNVKFLSEYLNGLPNLNIQSVGNFTLRLNHINLVQLQDSLSTIDAQKYIQSAIIGFSKTQNELLVTNSNYNYSYVYSFESGYWHKISKSYSILVNTYPTLQGIHLEGNGDGVFDLSHENFDTSVQAMFSTRPCKIDGNIDFVLIHRIIQRCEIKTKDTTFAGFYVFLSNDMKVWQLSQGNDKKTGEVTDLLCTRSHLKAKYFVFVFAADESEINTLELQY